MPELSEDCIITTPTTGIDLHIRDWGGDGPAVLLLHGLASSCRIYDLCAPLLRSAHRVVAYDQRGHGESAKPESGYDLETLVRDGSGVAQALGLPVPFIVVGHSWGASVALDWAVRRPDEVRAAVLVDGGVFSFRDFPGATWESVSQRLAPPNLSGTRFDDLLDRTRQGALAFLDERFRRDFFGALMATQPDGTIRARLSRENHMRILHAMWEYDPEAAYRALRRPAMALVAEREPTGEEQRQLQEVRRASVARLQEVQPLLRVRWLADTIHDVPLQRPEAVADAVAEL